MDHATPIELRPSDLPDLDALANDEDVLREAERLAPRLHLRMATQSASLAWKDAMSAVHGRAGWRRFGEGERAAYVDRHVARALADAAAQAELTTRVAGLLRELRDAPRPGPGRGRGEGEATARST